MDGFTLAAIIRALLASAGLKATLAIITVGGFFFVCWKTVQAVVTFMKTQIENSELRFSQTMQRVAEQDARRAQFERETMAILATINTRVEASQDLMSQTQKQMHERFNAL